MGNDGWFNQAPLHNLLWDRRSFTGFFSNLGTRAFLDPYFFSLLSEKPLFSPLLSVGGMTGASRGSAGGEHYWLL